MDKPLQISAGCTQYHDLLLHINSAPDYNRLKGSTGYSDIKPFLKEKSTATHIMEFGTKHQLLNGQTDSSCHHI